MDKAGNYEVVQNTVTFIYQPYLPSPSQSPQSVIVFPANGYQTNNWNNLLTVSGTAYDNPPGKIREMRVLLKAVISGTTSYWNNVTWVQSDMPINANSWPESDQGDNLNASNSSWTYTSMPAVPEAANITYYLYSEARDYAGNYEMSRETQTFVYNTIAPTAGIGYPSNGGYVSQTGQVWGTASDTLPGIIEHVLRADQDKRSRDRYNLLCSRVRLG